MPSNLDVFESIFAAWATMLGAWDDLRAVPEGMRELTVRGGRVSRLELYWDRDEALADLGLPEGTKL